MEKNKNLTGVFFKNFEKTNPNAPDLKGNIIIEDKEYKISAWLNKSKTGVEYYSIKAEEKLFSGSYSEKKPIIENITENTPF